MTVVEIIDAQASCITMLSRVVDGLFQQLSQHLTAEELDNIAEIKLVNDVAKLQHSIEFVASAQQINENAADMQQDERR